MLKLTIILRIVQAPHRLYGAAEKDGHVFRTLFTIKETRAPKDENSMHSYEVTEIELLDDPSLNNAKSNPNARGVDQSSNSITGTNLLKDAVKSKEKNVKLLEASTRLSNNAMQTSQKGYVL